MPANTIKQQTSKKQTQKKEAVGKARIKKPTERKKPEPRSCCHNDRKEGRLSRSNEAAVEPMKLCKRVRRAAEDSGPSTWTVEDRRAIHDSRSGPPAELTDGDEEALVHYSNYCAEMGYPLTMIRIAGHATAIWRKRNPGVVIKPFGESWWNNFTKRQPRVLFLLETYITDRHRAYCGVPFHEITPRQINSCDHESGFQINTATRLKTVTASAAKENRTTNMAILLKARSLNAKEREKQQKEVEAQKRGSAKRERCQSREDAGPHSPHRSTSVMIPPYSPPVGARSPTVQQQKTLGQSTCSTVMEECQDEGGNRETQDAISMLSVLMSTDLNHDHGGQLEAERETESRSRFPLAVETSDTEITDDSSDDEPLANKTRPRSAEEQLEMAVKTLLRLVDLETVTMREIIKTIIDMYPHLSNKKTYIKNMVKKYLSQ